MKYAILGTGALGGFYGGLLAHAGLDVHFLLRSDADHVRDNGLRVDSKLGDFYVPHVNAYSSVHNMPKCDVVILSIKSTQNASLPELLPPLLHEHSIVLVLQNGMHVEQAAREVAGRDRVVGGCCFLCSNKVGPGHIRHLDYGRILMGPYRGVDDSESGPSMTLIESIQTEFRSARIECDVTHALTLARWRKLMWNIPFNGLSVLLNASTDAIMKHPESRALARSISEEVRVTAGNCGYVIEPEFVNWVIDHTDDMVPYDSSMRLDFLAGRPIEVESIYGNSLKAAERAGFDAPIIRTMYRQLVFLADHRHLG